MSPTKPGRQRFDIIYDKNNYKRNLIGYYIDIVRFKMYYRSRGGSYGGFRSIREKCGKKKL